VRIDRRVVPDHDLPAGQQAGAAPMLILSRLAAALFVIALPVLLVTANVRFLASDIAYYRHGFREFDSSGRTGLPISDLDRAGEEIIEYFEDDAATLRILVTVDGQETSLFNAKETDHMRDVKTLIRAVYRLNEISLAVVLAYVACAVLWSGERSIAGLARLSLAGVGFGLLVVGLVGAFAITGFDQAWTTFHEVAFRNDLWRLDPDTDRLIQMFPEEFWQEATYIAGGLTLAEATLVVVVSLAYVIFSRGRDDDHAVTRAAGTGELQVAQS
jgi:integral membrane protein (TIGR01906 family)